MRLRHIEAIQAILQTGNLDHGAELLQLPAERLDATLREAEQQLGFMLFSSVRGRLQATRETLLLKPHITQIYQALDPLERLCTSLRQHQEPPLRVVCSEAPGLQLLPRSIAALRRCFADTPSTLSCQPDAEIVRRLLLGESDLGLCFHPCEHPAIECEPLAQGKLQLLAPHGWLQPRQKHISLQTLAGQPLISLEQHDPLSRLLDSKLQALHPAPVVQIRVQSYQLMRCMVEAGEGLALVDPFTAAGARHAGLDVCPVSPAIAITLYALTRKGANVSPALKTLLDIVRQQAETLVAGQGLVVR